MLRWIICNGQSNKHQGIFSNSPCITLVPLSQWPIDSLQFSVILGKQWSLIMEIRPVQHNVCIQNRQFSLGRMITSMILQNIAIFRLSLSKLARERFFKSILVVFSNFKFQSSVITIDMWLHKELQAFQATQLCNLQQFASNFQLL